MFCAPLLTADGQIDSDVFDLLTDAQQARLRQWSIQHDKPVTDLLRDARFMVVEFTARDDRSAVMLEGMLPHCGLHGAMLPDGSCDT
jgi:hypothetical protein